MIRNPRPIQIVTGALLSSWFVSLIPAQAGFRPAGFAGRDYQVIIDRNPFGLRPPPPPKTNAVPPATPPPEFVLTGITSFGHDEAYFMTKPRPGGASDFFNLGEGEKEKGLEVLDIDPESRSVRVRRSGVESVMNFTNSGVKPPPPGPAPSTRPGSRLASAKTPSLPGVRPNRGPHAAEQDVLIMELQKAAHPNVAFPPTPMPP